MESSEDKKTEIHHKRLLVEILRLDQQKINKKALALVVVSLALT